MSTETVIKQTERRTDAWKHAFVYFWLVFTTLAVLPGGSHSELAIAGALVLIAGVAAWYWYWQIGRTRPPYPRAHRLYLAGAVGAWLLLVLIDPGFLLLGVSVLAPYCFSHLRIGLALLVPFVAAWLWQEAVVGGGIDWYELSIAVLAFGSGGAVAGYIGTLAMQNAERRRLIEQLKAAQSERAAAERHAGVLAERQRLARDIHDTLTQSFASIVMLLEAVDESLDPRHPARSHVASALRSARDSLAESRRVVWALRPESLGEGHLPDAIRDLLARMEEETGIRTELVVTGTPRSLDRDVEIGLLRMIQEAFANVRKHAAATRLSATISYMDEMTIVDVQDDGAGFDPDTIKGRNGSGGIGLRAMHERAAELGGRLVVESAPGEGTTVVMEMPTVGGRTAEARA